MVISTCTSGGDEEEPADVLGGVAGQTVMVCGRSLPLSKRGRFLVKLASASSKGSRRGDEAEAETETVIAGSAAAAGASAKSWRGELMTV